LRKATSTHTGYLAIFVIGLLLCIGVQFETRRQDLVAWQNHLAAQQNKSKDTGKKVDAFFSALNDNLGTISSLPNVRKLQPDGQNLTPEDRETIQQVYNNLAKSADVSEIYVTPLEFDPVGREEIQGPAQKPILQLDHRVMPARDLDHLPTAAESEADSEPERIVTHQEEFLQIKRHIGWFKLNYPDIASVKSYALPMVSDEEIETGDLKKSLAPETLSDTLGITFSVPYYGKDGRFAGCISAVVFSNVLGNVTHDKNYILISPLAKFVSAPLVRDSNIRMMLHASEQRPDNATIFSEALVIDTHDARGKWQLTIHYPVADYFNGQQFRAIRYFEYGSYAALALLTLAGMGWHHSVLRRAHDMKSNAAALQAVNYDISKLNHELAENMKELRAAQDEIIKKGKLAQMGQLVATVAHELRNPLSSVRTSAFLLRRKLVGLPINVDAQLQRIDNSVARCDAVITQFLDYAKSHKVERVEQNFDNWVARIVEEEAQKLPAAVAVECILGLEDRNVSFDQSRLSRAVINLLSNASEAMVGKGDDPAKFACAQPKITVVTRVSEDCVEIDVCDNGPGIAEENVARILEPLFTTKSFGTGLGLSAVCQVLEQHGGGIRIKGGFGTGATFTAWLPLKYQQTQAA
jgi:signal transduction histidine kinase